MSACTGSAILFGTLAMSTFTLLGCSDTQTSHSSDNASPQSAQSTYSAPGVDSTGQYWPEAGTDGQGLGNLPGNQNQPFTPPVAAENTGNNGTYWPTAGTEGDGLGSGPIQQNQPEAQPAGAVLPGAAKEAGGGEERFWPEAGSDGVGLGSSMSR